MSYSTSSSSSSSSSCSDDGASSSSFHLTNRIIPMIPQMIQHSLQYEEPPQRKRKGKRTYINRKRVERNAGLVKDYFNRDPIYDAQFRRRFRMRRVLFDNIMRGVCEQDNYFLPGVDAVGRASLSTHQKLTASIRMLAYGVSADAVDDYCRMGESTAMKCLTHLCTAVVRHFGPTYMRRANEEDLRRLLAINAKRGFSGMIGSIDCMHWEWKNCPKAWAGQFQGRSGKPTLVLVAVASQDTWIWDSFFGLSGKNNDLTVVQCSPVFDDLLNGVAPRVEFEVNGHLYTMPYYLVDDIYPGWATFIPDVTNPVSHKDAKFSEWQESCRKDVERAFGVLQARFAILKNLALAHSRQILRQIMDCCITLHNMIVEDERDGYLNYDKHFEDMVAEFNLDTQEVVDGEFLNGVKVTNVPSTINSIPDYMKNEQDMQSFIKHDELKHDLIEHIYRIR